MGRGRAVLGARRRPSGPARPAVLSTPLGPLSSPPTLFSPLPGGPGARCGATITAWRSGGTVVLGSRVARQARGARPDLARRGVEGWAAAEPPQESRAGGTEVMGKACVPGCQGLKLQRHFSPWRAGTRAPREAGGQRGGEGGRRRRLGWAGGLGRRGAGGRGQGPC